MPRRILPGLAYFLTRRCTQRNFLLRPDKHVNLVLLYLLAEAALRFNITVYAFCAMSNHVHMVVRDNEGNLPEFMAHFYKLVAKVLNVHWERTENLWSNEQASVVRLLQENDVFDKILYTLLNPINDNLVERVHHWPGITSYEWMLSGKKKTTERPRGFFRDGGPMDEEVVLTLARPPGYEHMTQKQWAEELGKHVRAKEEEMREARKRDPKLRKRFVGRQRVLAAKHTDTATRIESPAQLRPQVACLNGDLRMGALLELKAFRKAHEYARVVWSAGNRSEPFPRGTYKMKSFGVLVDGETPPKVPTPGVSKARPRPSPLKATARRGRVARTS